MQLGSFATNTSPRMPKHLLIGPVPGLDQGPCRHRGLMERRENGPDDRPSLAGGYRLDPEGDNWPALRRGRKPNDQAGLSPCYLLASYRSLFGAGVLMIKLTIAIGALAAMNTAAHSTTTVDQWIALCSKGVSPSCESYVLGVADAVVAIQATRPQQSTTCIPPSVTGKDLVALVLPYVQGQPPAARQLLAAGLLMDVFREAFPCPRK